MGIGNRIREKKLIRRKEDIVLVYETEPHELEMIVLSEC